MNRRARQRVGRQRWTQLMGSGSGDGGGADGESAEAGSFGHGPGRCGHEPLRIRTSTILCVVLAVTLLVTGCRREPPPTPPATPEAPVARGPLQLEDVTEATGIDFLHNDGSSGRRYIIEPMCAGMALLDYDNDGWIDIYFLNGAPLPGTQVDVPPRNHLYRNLGNWTFVDVTEASGTGDEGFGLGVTAADFDNDGDQDLYINNAGPNVLLRNNGDGTFTDITTAAGVANNDLVGAGTVFLDMDADGDLDLYVGNYLLFNPAEHRVRITQGYPTYPSPRDFHPVVDTLYRNEGDGTFTDVSEQSGVTAYAGTSMGMVAADYDDDGDTDVFVLNDVHQNFLFRNDGKGNFEEVAMLTGVAFNGYGMENASMGVDCGDIDGDGLLDFYMTSYQTENPVYYRNLGAGRFEDATQESQAADGLFPYVNWGIGLVDFDNDGDLDIFVANGHTEDNVDLYDTSTAYRVKNTVQLNKGGGRFTNVSDQCGSGLLPVQASRGTGFNDLDNDGDVDGVIVNSRERPTVLRNDTHDGSEDAKPRWVELRLIGIRSNRDGVGSRVIVTAGDSVQVKEVHSGRGYQSHYDMRLHFGLGTHSKIDRLEIRWLGSGLVETIENLEVDQLHLIREGSGTPTQPEQ